MNKQIDELMRLADTYATRVDRYGEHASQTSRDKLRAALESALKPGEPLPGEVTEEMHQAACKVLLHANGLDGTPQRMLDAMRVAAPPVQTPLPTHETPAMHAAVMKVMYEGGVTRTTTDKLWQAYHCAITSDTPPAQTPAKDMRSQFEAWAKSYSTLSIDRDLGGAYVDMNQEMLWHAFQAGVKA